VTDLVYEIGTEEIPAGYLPPVTRQLESEARKFFEGAMLRPHALETHATPRRIVLFAKGLPDRQSDRTELVTGPPWKAAFDAQGKPTKAAEGFAKGRGLDVASLTKVETERGPYAGATVTIRGQVTIDLLSKALPEMTAKLTFPKTMRWGRERFRFARPIRWLLALFGDKLVPFEIEGVRTGRTTCGHRILAKGPFEVRHASEYEDALAKGRVVLRSEDRKARIARELGDRAREIGGTVVSDPDLVEEVAYLVETPSAFVGDFDAEFLELPRPVIVTAMRDHQRYFAVSGSGGKLLPHFVCVANSAPESAPAVKDGNQRVLRARLDDARFYWNEDLRTTLEQKLPALEKVVWLEGFGTLRDKTSRIQRLAVHLAAGASKETKRTVERAALLAKTDLVTEMIKDGKEFTSLQGLMAKEYALKNGESAMVAEALEEQYRPRFAGDQLPKTESGALLAVADRIDTITGVWGAGLKPTGSKDPFALRRQSLGVIRILLERDLDLSFEDLFEFAAASYGERLSDPRTLVREVCEFVRERMAVYLVEEEGFEADAVAAVASRSRGPVDCRARVRALSALRSSAREDFEALAAGLKRAKNILKKESAEGEPSRAPLVEEAEKTLYEAFHAVNGRVAAAEEGQRYLDAFTDLASLRAPIDRFFDSVLVMADDESVRKNRLRLLGRIVDRVESLADLSKIALPAGGSGAEGGGFRNG
jgi:glycyl-tRNA synthetase beta chain